MDLTKERAIQLTYELWKWMKDNKAKSKDKWPGWGKYGRMEHQCPCCQYKYDNKNSNISWEINCINLCPLLNIWPAKRPSGLVPCCRKGSPFRTFEAFEGDENYDGTTKIIIKMETAIKKEMKRLKIKPLKENI